MDFNKKCSTWLHLIFAFIVSLFLFPQALATTSQSKKPETITWTTEVWTKVAEENGTGAYFDLLQAIFPEPEYKLVHRFYPYKRGVEYVKQSKIDIFSHCLSMPNFIIPKYPWAQESLGLFYPKKGGRIWSGLESLNQATVSVNHEISILPFIKDLNARFIKTKNRLRALKLLNLGRVDYLLGIYINIADTIATNPLISLEDYHFQPLHVVTCHPGFLPSVRGKRLMEVWEQGIYRLHQQGKLKAIFDKWNLEYPTFNWPQKALLKTAAQKQL